MTGGLVFGAVILFLAIFLLCPVIVRCGFETELSLSVRFLFFRYRFLPAKVAKKPPVEKKAGPEKEEGKKARIWDILKQKGLSGFLQILGKTAEIAKGSAKKLFAHLKVTEFLMEISVSSDDAAQTAARYGQVSGAVAAALGTLLSLVRCRKYDVRVVPDFRSGESRIRFRMKARIPLIFLLYAALYAFVRILRLTFRLKKDAALSMNYKKGGA